MDGVERQLEVVPADERVEPPFDAKLAFAAQRQDQLLLLGEDLAAGRVARSLAAVLQPGLALGGVAPEPFARGDLGEAATAADDAPDADLLGEPDPAEPGLRVHGVPPEGTGSAVDLLGNASALPTVPQPPPPARPSTSGR